MGITKQTINDLDHFAILKAIQNKDKEFLKDMTIELNSRGIKSGTLVSDMATMKNKLSISTGIEEIKFPFELE